MDEQEAGGIQVNQPGLSEQPQLDDMDLYHMVNKYLSNVSDNEG